MHLVADYDDFVAVVAVVDFGDLDAVAVAVIAWAAAAAAVAAAVVAATFVVDLAAAVTKNLSPFSIYQYDNLPGHEPLRGCPVDQGGRVSEPGCARRANVAPFIRNRLFDVRRGGGSVFGIIGLFFRNSIFVP